MKGKLKLLPSMDSKFNKIVLVGFSTHPLLFQYNVARVFIMGSKAQFLKQ